MVTSMTKIAPKIKVDTKNTNFTRNTCLAEPRETRGRVQQKFSDRVGRDGTSVYTGEVELHGHNGPEI